MVALWTWPVDVLRSRALSAVHPVSVDRPGGHSQDAFDALLGFPSELWRDTVADVQEHQLGRILPSYASGNG
jgi:hypothetical protein